MSIDMPYTNILLMKGNRHMISPRTVYDFFSKYNKVNIPKYQRPYSWTENHVDDLLNDIMKTYEMKQKDGLLDLFLPLPWIMLL